MTMKQPRNCDTGKRQTNRSMIQNRKQKIDIYNKLAGLSPKNDSIRLEQKILCLKNCISLFKKKRNPGVHLSCFTKQYTERIRDLVMFNFRCQIDGIKKQILRVTAFPTMESI